MSNGIIFDIKHYAIHDGPGIRTTVFLKGCGLQCQWCQNPEGQEFEPELMIREYRCAKECNACISACPQNAISKNGNLLELDNEKCDLCGKCADVCVYEALEIVGRKVSVKEVVDEVEKDKVFFEESGGGVTFSGGEPLLQPDFLDALLDEMKKRQIHVALDTCGYVSKEDLEKIIDKVDLILYDLKIMDDRKHKRYTGVSNRTILENLQIISEKEKEANVRIPLLSGINDDNRSIQTLIEYLRPLKNIRQISLLPYHRGGYEKSRRLRKEKILKIFHPPSVERVQKIKKILEDSGFTVKTGG